MPGYKSRLNFSLEDSLGFTFVTKASGCILCQLYDMFLQSEEDWKSLYLVQVFFLLDEKK